MKDSRTGGCVSRIFCEPAKLHSRRFFLMDETMSFQEIWQQLVRKQPKISDDDSEIIFKAGNLRHLLRQVYEQGQASSKPAASEEPRISPNPFDVFGGNF